MKLAPATYQKAPLYVEWGHGAIFIEALSGELILTHSLARWCVNIMNLYEKLWSWGRKGRGARGAYCDKHESECSMLVAELSDRHESEWTVRSRTDRHESVWSC